MFGVTLLLLSALTISNSYLLDLFGSCPLFCADSQCSSIGCMNCKSGYCSDYVQSGATGMFICVPKCGEGKICVTGGLKAMCTACRDSHCAECSSTGDNACTSCKLGYRLHGHTCS